MMTALLTLDGRSIQILLINLSLFIEKLCLRTEKYSPPESHLKRYAINGYTKIQKNNTLLIQCDRQSKVRVQVD